MYEIIYNNEVIDTAKNGREAFELVKEYREAFNTYDAWSRRA